MKFFKNNYKLLIGFLIGVISTGGIVYAAISAGQVNYTKEGTDIKNVQEALNDLYHNKKVTSDDEYEITENDTYELDKYYKNINVNVEPTLSGYTSNFYLSGDSRANYSRYSYFDIDVSHYNKLTFYVSYIWSKPAEFTCYVSTDGTTRVNITKTGTYEVDVTNNSQARLYYYEKTGYMYVTGTYTLSNNE